jgi:hypothetical protein
MSIRFTQQILLYQIERIEYAFFYVENYMSLLHKNVYLYSYSLFLMQKTKTRLTKDTFVDSKETVRIVTVASVRLPEEDAMKIAAYARLSKTKVEAIATDLMLAFIRQRIKLEVVPTQSGKDYDQFIKSCIAE